jgi:hypothetical protein
MRMRRAERARHAVPLQILLLILLVVLPACGKKGAVRPLLKAEPAAPGRPETRQIGGAILLFVDLPEHNLDGTPLTDLNEVRIYRRETADGVCAECDEPTALWRTIDPFTAQRQGQRLIIRDDDVRPGYGYRYRLVPVTSLGVTGAPAALARQLHPFPPAPQELTATGLDRMVRLHWTESSDLAPGWTSLGCQLFRSTGDAPFGLAPLTSQPVQGGSYDDIGPLNGTLYRYQLRCLAKQGETIVDSPPSAVIAVTPQPE